MSKYFKKIKVLTAGLLAILQIAGGILIPLSFVKAAIPTVGPTDPANGFPAWYADENGLRLQPCLGDANGIADVNCVLPLAGEEANFNPALPISFPDNFPSEFFYWIAEAELPVSGSVGSDTARIRLALEGAFNSATGAPAAGSQATFLRVNIQQLSGLNPGSTYRVIYPFGEFNLVTDAAGETIPQGVAGNGAAFRAQDGCTDLATDPCTFELLIPATTTHIGPFLKSTAATTPAGYIGDGITVAAVTGGTNGNNFRIEGTNVGGAGIDFVETSLFTVAGKIAPNNAPVITAIGDQNVTVNNPVSFTVTATDADLDTITYSITASSAVGNENAATINATTGDFSWSPNAVGNSTFTIGASDGQTTTTATVAINVSAAPDTEAPTVPTGLTATASSATQVDLTWTASTDNVGVTGYTIFRDGISLVDLGNVTSYQDTTVQAATTYSYTILAKDAVPNASAQSNPAVSVTTPAVPDTEAPTVPADLTATATSATQIDLTWTASTDNVGVTGYVIYRNGVELATVAAPATTYSDTTVQPSTTYSYTVAAKDAIPNISAQSTAASATTPADPDSEAPTVPTGLTATATSATQVDLSWTASTDNVGVTNYVIYRDGVQLTTVADPTTSYADTTAQPNTAYAYTVGASIVAI